MRSESETTNTHQPKQAPDSPRKGKAMNTQKSNEEKIQGEQLQKLVSDLSNKDGIIRRHARQKLEQAGTAAVDYLIASLDIPDDNTRWEATKALGHIGDPKAAPALVHALMDDSFEVQWLAAEGLIALGEAAIEPLLEGLAHNYGSIFMRQGAHHVLHDLERRKLLPDGVLHVLGELRSLEPLEPFPISARRALKELFGKTVEPPASAHNDADRSEVWDTLQQ